METPNAAADYSGLPGAHINIDQLVAMNMQHWRRAAGLTQRELGELIGQSAANVSAYERSADPANDKRRFDAHTLVAVARALQLPVIALLLPPPDDGVARRYLFEAGPGDTASMADLFSLIVPEPSGEVTGVMADYRKRYAGLADQYLGPGRGDELAAYAGELSTAEQRTRLLRRIGTQRSALTSLIADLDKSVESIATWKDTPDG